MLLLAVAAHADEDSMEAQLFAPDAVAWSSGPPSLPPGAEMAVLEGDPTREGPFVMRLRLPNDYVIPAHTHPKTERLTVIAGTFHIVMGDNLDRKKAEAMPAGSFGYWAAGMKHLVWAEGETIVQLHGMGPWQINYLDPKDDPRKQGK